MGSLYNSNATLVYNIINWIGIIAGVGCVAMLLFSLIHIMTGDESDHSKYLRRIKNGIIALILILCVTQITGLVTKYFNPNKVAKNSIGNFRQYADSTGQNIAQNVSDKKNRKMIVVDEAIYVCTDNEKKVGFNGSWSKKITVNVYKRYDDCQGATSGSFADDCYYLFKWNAGGFGSNIDEKWRRNDNYLLSAQAVKNTKVENDEQYTDFMNRYAIKKGSVDDGGWYFYSNENNPFSEKNMQKNAEKEKQKQQQEYEDEYREKYNVPVGPVPAPVN